MSIVATLSERLDQVVAPILAPHVGGRIFLLDAPDHSNVGDQAILLGELAFLRRHFPAAEIVLASNKTFTPELAASIRPEDVVTLHGGGNFGDIWPKHHNFRLEVLRRFADRFVLQFPQSVSFGSDAALDETRTAVAECANFHLLARDERTLGVAQTSFDCAVTLCPDMAFAMGPLTPHVHLVEAYCLLRTDKETRGRRDEEIAATLEAAGLSHEVGDWLEGEGMTKRLHGMHRRMTKAAIPTGLVKPYGNYAFEKYARARLDYGIDLLSRGRIVVTDRLHGQIISVLLGRPVFVFDSLDGKVSAFKRTWLDDASSTVVTSVDDLAAKLPKQAVAA